MTAWRWANGESMAARESQNQTFVVKIWLEEVGGSGGGTWRGRIDHVPDAERRYFVDLDEIPGLIAPYLEQMGIRLKRTSPLRLWLRRWIAPRRRAAI
jgi:hypothetical protein